ncbi:hypothetical protein [Enterococcus lemanii]|uniref:Sugar isomerase n=1 Tax=Enterococcus lemanii TaxID=1159752 RepID=A0ABV9MVF3_9ENTE|nr:hypothetical protein [Enterococcus lemanii]MBM7709066.1 O-antigen/teichoic acid export membrane protein [Enterococcus lemanii]
MRTKNAAYNLGTSLLLSLITAISGLILPKLFIVSYGSTINGLISSVKQFIVYLSLVEAGIGYASIAMLYSPVRLDDKNKINSILSTAKKHYSDSGKLFFLLIISLSIIYPLIVLNQISWITGFFMVLVLGLGSVVEFFVIGKYRVFLTAIQKGYIIYLVQTIGVIINILVTITLVNLNINLILVQLIATSIYSLRFVFLKVYIQKNYKWVDYTTSSNEILIKDKKEVLIHQVVNLILVNLPIIFITIFLGLKEVSVFTIYLLVHNMIVMVLSVFMTGFQSIFGDIIAENNVDTLKKNFHLFEWLFYSLTSIIYVCTTLLYIPFITIYTSGISDENYIRPTIAILFIFIGVLHNLRVPYMSILNSAGLFKETKNSAILEAILSLLISLLLINRFQIEGVLLGWLIAHLYRLIKLIKQISIEYIYKSCVPTLKLIVINFCSSLLSYCVCKLFEMPKILNYSTFFYNGIIYFCVVSLIFLLLNYFFYKEELLLLFQKVFLLIKKIG